MRLFESVPEVIADQKVNQPWHVFAIEAAPLIAPYVERCAAALASGKPLPPPPVPPAGSSMQLLNYADELGCTAAVWHRWFELHPRGSNHGPYQ